MRFLRSAETKRQEQITAYVDGHLSASETAQFESEMQVDSTLRTDVKQLQLLKTSIQSLPKARAPRNFTLDPATYTQSVASAEWRRYRIAQTATAFTALLFMLCLGLLLTNANILSSPQVTNSGATDSTEFVADTSVLESPAREDVSNLQLENQGDMMDSASSAMSEEMDGADTIREGVGDGEDGSAELTSVQPQVKSITVDDSAMDDSAMMMEGEIAADAKTTKEEITEPADQSPSAGGALADEPSTDTDIEESASVDSAESAPIPAPTANSAPTETQVPPTSQPTNPTVQQSGRRSLLSILTILLLLTLLVLIFYTILTRNRLPDR